MAGKLQIQNLQPYSTIAEKNKLWELEVAIFKLVRKKATATTGARSKKKKEEQQGQQGLRCLGWATFSLVGVGWGSLYLFCFTKHLKMG